MGLSRVRARIGDRRLVALLGVALVVLLLVLRVASQPRDRVWDRMMESGVWRVAMDPSFPPFESLDDAGLPVGYDVDLARAMAARWGVEAQIEGIGFDGLVDAVWAGRVDSALSAIPVQPQFSENVAFSRPYFEAGLVLVQQADQPAVENVDQLAGQRVAVEWGSEGDLQARILRRRLAGVEIVPAETASAALAEVAAGRAHVALVDRISVLAYAGRDKLRVAAEPVVADPFVVVLPRKAPLLQQMVEETLAELEEDGTLAALEAKWFGVGAQ